MEAEAFDSTPGENLLSLPALLHKLKGEETNKGRSDQPIQCPHGMENSPSPSNRLGELFEGPAVQLKFQLRCHKSIPCAPGIFLSPGGVGGWTVGVAESSPVRAFLPAAVGFTLACALVTKACSLVWMLVQSVAAPLLGSEARAWEFPQAG